MPFDTSEFQNTIYHDSQRYDDEMYWKKDDMEFWKLILDTTPNKKILELGAGTGRLAVPLIREGAHYTGLEISSEFCKTAQHKIADFGNNHNIIQGDMRNFNLNQSFDLIFIGFNSFLHLLSDDDAIACIESAKKHMVKGKSRFIIDIFVPDPLFLYRPENMKYPVMEYIDSKTNEKVLVEETSEYDPATEINKISWFYKAETPTDNREYNFTMRMFFPDTMNRILTDAGFTIQNVWGDHYQTPFNEGSTLQIYDCIL
jgi:SAM-dependent methyltransferase